ncbi:MAG: hypothetical protein WKG07_05245 [Hymenobacter sp.]
MSVTGGAGPYVLTGGGLSPSGTGPFVVTPTQTTTYTHHRHGPDGRLPWHWPGPRDGGAPAGRRCAGGAAVGVPHYYGR